MSNNSNGAGTRPSPLLLPMASQMSFKILKVVRACKPPPSGNVSKILGLQRLRRTYLLLVFSAGSYFTATRYEVASTIQEKAPRVFCTDEVGKKTAGFLEVAKSNGREHVESVI
jgi:hypothetical protein